MRKWLSKIDFTLVFRLCLSIAMGVSGIVQNDNTSIVFGLFLLVYALFAAKYKIGCGYNACGYTPRTSNSYESNNKDQHIDFTEVK